MRNSTVALAAFGLLALAGLIVLAATSHADDATRTALVSIVTAALGAIAGVSIPRPPPP